MKSPSTRSLPLGILLCLFASLSCLLGAQPSGEPQASRPPNIIFLLSDDQSAPYLGCYGYPIETPALNKLAAEGVRFTRAFTAAPQCVPSRVAYMTGRSPAAARVGRFSSPLPKDVITLPEILSKEAGYFTGVCGRSHHLDGWVPATDKVSLRVWEQHKLQFMKHRVDFEDVSSQTKALAKTSEFLGKVPEGKPFFLWINFNDPHHPWVAPKVCDPKKLPLPADWPDIAALREDLARHCDEIVNLDKLIGQLMELLASKGALDNTIIVFAADNGMALPRGKGALHERGIHVPLIVRWPGSCAPAVRDDLVSGEDLTPTLLDVAGLKARPEMSGRSFLPAIKGQAYEQRRYVFAQRGPHGAAVLTPDEPSSGYDLGRSVRDDRFKLILNYTPWQRYSPVDSSKDPGWTEILALSARGQLEAPFQSLFFTSPRPYVELYDLKADPYELNNLAGQPSYAVDERRLKEALQEKMILDYDFLPLPTNQ